MRDILIGATIPPWLSFADHRAGNATEDLSKHPCRIGSAHGEHSSAKPIESRGRRPLFSKWKPTHRAKMATTICGTTIRPDIQMAA
jgi:hypothetical protein